MLSGLLTLRLAEHGAQVYVGLKAVSDLQPFGSFHQLGRELFRHLLCHIDSIDTDADLAHIGEGALAAGGSGSFQICILADDEGRLAAQLQRDPLDMGCGVSHYPASGICLSGECNLAGDRVFHELRSDLASRAMHCVRRACWQARVTDRTHELRGCERSLARRFGHECAACCQSRADLPGQKIHREVPGRDERGDAYGLPSTMLRL